MYCLAILDSGNYAFHLCRSLEKKGYVFEVVSIPCQIAKDGCSYCLKFPIEFKDFVINEAHADRLMIKEIYKIVPGRTKNKYERIY